MAKDKYYKFYNPNPEGNEDACDCEDTIRFNCEKCGEELVVKVWATEYRVSTQAADDYDKEYAERLKGIEEWSI